MPSSSSSWSVILQIFVIFSCLFVFVASRPADLLQFDDGSNDGGELLNIQRLQKLPYAVSFFFKSHFLNDTNKIFLSKNIFTEKLILILFFVSNFYFMGYGRYLKRRRYRFFDTKITADDK